MEFAQQPEYCQFALRVEAVAALGFERRGAMGRELPQCRERSCFQRFRFCLPQCADCRENSAAFARDFFVGCASNALFVFGGAAGGENQVSMGVDKAGQDYASTQIQCFCDARFGKARHLATRSRRDDGAVAYQYGAIAHNTKVSHCIAATRDAAAKSKKFLAPCDEKRLGHSDTIMAQKKARCILQCILKDEKLFGPSI